MGATKAKKSPKHFSLFSQQTGYNYDNIMPRSFKTYSTGTYQRRAKLVRGYQAARAARARTVRQTIVAPAGEMKYYDAVREGTALSATTTTWVAGTLQNPSTSINLGGGAVATPGCLFAPTVGAALNQRIGRKVNVHSVKLRGNVVVPAQTANTNPDAATRVRVILVQDTQTNAGAMTAAQLMNDGTAADNTLSSFQNPNNFGRFKVLKDKTYSLTNVNMTGSPTSGDVIQSGIIVPFKFTHAFKKPVQVNFNATNGGTVADIIDNSFHFIAAVQTAQLAPIISYYSRVGYKE